MKIAITTTDGITVNQHFGKANCFYIYEKTSSSLNFLEKRDVMSYGEYVDDKHVDPNHKFNEERFLLVYNKIKDCQILYTQQIGEKPLQKLNSLGIDAQLCSCSIELITDCEGNCNHYEKK